MEINYQNFDKNKCWYKNICKKDLCDNNSFCIRHYKMSNLIALSTMEGNQCYSIPLIPDKVDYEAYTKLKDIKNNIKDFVEKGDNLLIYSNNTGNGKTEWSKKLLLSYFNSIWQNSDLVCRGLFISLPKLMPSMKDNIQNENKYFQYVEENLLKADIIIWDEINYKDWSAYEQDFMLNILSQRLAIGKSNIYTTNYNLKQVEQKLGSRLASRIIGNSIKIEFKGTDKRGWKGI